MKIIWILILFPIVAFGQNNLEILNPINSTLNGNILSFGFKEQLTKSLGRPTKVQDIDYECGVTEEQEFAQYQKYYFYGKTHFFVYDEKYELKIIDFKTGKFTYKTPQIILTNRTTFEEIKKIFPKATKASIIESKGRLVRLKPCNVCDGEVQLFFENGKLIQLELWEPC
jgi:hypothetical protein